MRNRRMQSHLAQETSLALAQPKGRKVNRRKRSPSPSGLSECLQILGFVNAMLSTVSTQPELEARLQKDIRSLSTNWRFSPGEAFKPSKTPSPAQTSTCIGLAFNNLGSYLAGCIGHISALIYNARYHLDKMLLGLAFYLHHQLVDILTHLPK